MTIPSNRSFRTLLLMLAATLMLAAGAQGAYAQSDSTGEKIKRRAEEAQIRSLKDALRITIRNVDISHFPQVDLIVEAADESGSILDSINPKQLTVEENGVIRPVVSVKKISVEQRIPVDFIFAIDVTGTMQPYINGVRNNVETFVQSLVNRGIDYRLGLVAFSDVIEKTYQPTDNVKDFMKWISSLYAQGGLDEKENALEAFAETGRIKFRPSANKVCVIVTDAPYHQAGDRGGNGRTTYTTESIIQLLKQNEVRAFCIVPPTLREYRDIALSTRGTTFDISLPFSKILDAYSTQLTNLYAISYRSDQTVIPDSIRVAILDQQKRALVRQIIPIVEIGRKIIIENLLFKSSSSALPDSVPELDVLTEFLKNRKTVAIRIEGHTDSKGNPKSNKLLSYQRAESVKKFLVDKGVSDRRIQIVGFGDTRPIADNSTDFGRSLNRRTEVVIISK